MLVHVLKAFERIAAGQAAFELQDETQVYRFEGFSVTLEKKEKPNVKRDT
jgi:hypothetical protein